MYKVFPSLILRAAMVRARSLELGGVNDYYTSSSAPSSSTLVAAAPSATNVYVLAFGEREGLAPGERLEVYGGRVRLVRTLAYGCPRGVSVESAFTGRLTAEDLNGITEQLDALHPCGTDMRKLITLQLQQGRASAAASDSTSSLSPSNSVHSKERLASGGAASSGEAALRRSHDWTLRLPEIQNSRVLRRSVSGDGSGSAAASVSREEMSAQLERMRRSCEEVVVAEWISRDFGRENSDDLNRKKNQRIGGAGTKETLLADQTYSGLSGGAEGSNGDNDTEGLNSGGVSNTVALTDENGIPLSAQKANNSKKSSKNGGDDEDENSANDALLMENGVCFRSADSCGLRALRTARLAFISSIERTANGLARRQHRRLSGEEPRPLEVLDVNAIDFTFAHAALQSTLELGLHTGEACRITHVPLTHAAAEKVEAQAASYIRIVASGGGGCRGGGAGRALPRPFDFIPTHSFDVGAYTAYLPLPLGALTQAETAGSCANVYCDDCTPSAASPSSTASTTYNSDGKNSSSSSSKSSGAKKDMNTQAPSPQHRQSTAKRNASGKSGIGGTKFDRQQLAVQLSQALATLRRGACMLVTFVPTPTTVAALYHEMETQHHAEVLIEHRMVAHSKACIAEAISRTGRWGYITDEVLPAVDSPQGSAFSLMVVLE